MLGPGQHSPGQEFQIWLQGRLEVWGLCGWHFCFSSAEEQKHSHGGPSEQAGADLLSQGVFYIFLLQGGAREVRWGHEGLSLRGRGPGPPLEGQESTNLGPQAGMTFHWGPGSDHRRRTSSGLYCAVVRAPGRRARGPPVSGDPEQAPEQQGLVKSPLPASKVTEGPWSKEAAASPEPGGPRLHPSRCPRAVPPPPGVLSAPKEPREVTTVLGGSGSPPTVGCEPHLLLVPRAGRLGLAPDNGRSGAAGPSAGKGWPPPASRPILLWSLGPAALGWATGLGLSSFATRGSCAPSTEASRVAMGPSRPGQGRACHRPLWGPQGPAYRGCTLAP